MREILNKKKHKKILLFSLMVMIIFIIIIVIIFSTTENKGILTTNAVNSYLSKNTHWYTNDATELNNGFDLKIESKSIVYNKNSWKAIVDGNPRSNADGYIPKHNDTELILSLKNKISNHDIELQLNKIGYSLKNSYPTSGTTIISGKSSKKYEKDDDKFFFIDLTKIRAKSVNVPLKYLNIGISQDSTFTFDETTFSKPDTQCVSHNFSKLPTSVVVKNANNPGNKDVDFHLPLTHVFDNLKLDLTNFFQKTEGNNLWKIAVKNENLVINWSLKK